MSSTFPQYQYAQQGVYPDPTQWSNPYSNFQNQALPFPPGYSGTPTNAATGQPIQQPPGTTLNSMPASTPQAAVPQQNNMQALQSAYNQAQGQLQAMGKWGITPGTGNGMGGVNNQAALDAQSQLAQSIYRNQQPAASSASTPSMQPASQAGSYQNALNLLANPGTPQMAGAAFTPQQAQAGSGGQNVLNNFIQNWQQGGIGQQAAPGIGGGSSGISFGANNPFFAALGAKK